MDKDKLPFPMKNIKNAIIDSDVKVEGNLTIGDINNYNFLLPSDVPFDKFELPEATIPRTIVEEKSDIYAHQAWLYPDGDMIAFNASLSNFIIENPKTLLLGGAGYGKTTELKQLYNQILEEGVFKPFFIDLGKGNIRPIENYQPNLQVFEAKDLVILIDSLDELSQMSEAIDNILQFTNNKGRGAIIVVSCRTNVQPQNLADFQPCFLQLPHQEQIKEYVSSRLGAHSDTFLTAINAKNLYELIQIPFYLEQLIAYFEDNKQNIPNDKNGLFEYLVNKSIDTKLQPATGMAIDQKVKKKARIALEKLAFSMQCLQVSGMTETQVAEFIEDDEERSLLQKSSSLLDTTDGNWSFKHLNFQEYLAAVKIANLSFKEMKKLIGIKGFNYNRIHPKWLNTLSFVLPLLHEYPKKEQAFLAWLRKNEPHFILGFESDRLSNEFKGQLFIEILERYKIKKSYLNYSYPIMGLIKFIKTDTSATYLLQELQNVKDESARSNIISLLSFASINDIPLNFRQELKELLWGTLMNPNEKISIIRESLNVYVSLFSLTEAEMSQVFDQYFDEQPIDFKERLLLIVSDLSYQDKFIDQKLIIIKNRLNEASDTYTTAQMEDFFRQIQTGESIIKYVKFYEANFEEDIIHQKLNKINEIVFEKALLLTPDSPELFDLIKRLIDKIGMPGSPNYGRNHYLIKFLENTNQINEMFQFIYQNMDEKHRGFNALIALSGEEQVRFLFDEFQAGKIGKDLITAYHNCLFQKDKHLFSVFHAMVNEVIEEKIPVPIDYHELSKQRYKERMAIKILTKKLLFNKEEYMRAVERIFGDNEVLDEQKIKGIRSNNSNEINQMHPPFILMHLDWEIRDSILEKEAYLSWIDAHWDCCFAVSEMRKFLKAPNSIEFEQEGIDLIKEWCRKQLEKDVEVLDCLESKNGNEYFEIEKILLFFIAFFKITDFDDSYYLDLFWKGSGNENMIQFAENVKKVPKERIIERVIGTIKNGLYVDTILDQHLDYCIENKLDNIAVDLLQYIGDSRINQKMIIDTYMKLNGDLLGLETNLPKLEDYLRFYVLENLIEKRSPNIENILLRDFHKAEGKTQIKYAKYLMLLENKTAFKFLVEKLENDEMVIRPGFFNPITNKRNWKDANLLIDFIRLYLLDTSDAYMLSSGFRHHSGEIVQHLVRENSNQFKKLDREVKWYRFKCEIEACLPEFMRKKWNLQATKSQVEQLKNLWKRVQFDHYSNQKLTIAQIKEFL